jgi:hypothetical protein
MEQASGGLRKLVVPEADNARPHTMAFFTFEVVSNPSGLLPYKVVFKGDGSVLGEWPVGSMAEGEERIAAARRSISDLAPEDNRSE